MPFDWGEFLNIAKVHIGEVAYPCTAAKDRAAISRAYYAAFKTTHQYISATRSAPDIGIGGAAHTRLPKWLKSQPTQDLRQIGVWLVRLRKRRTKADYDEKDISRVHDVAYDAVRDSWAVLQAISAKP
jgi:hypothetical protein